MKIDEYILKLPDSYAKKESSNNYKLLTLEQRLVDGLRGDIEEVYQTGDINSASGITLDLYGAMYNQSRGSMIDEQFRYVIMQTVAQNRIGGDYNSIVTALANALGVEPTEFVLSETENVCEVRVDNLPYAILSSAGITATQVYQIIKRTLPAGVALAGLNLEGTFEFADGADEYDASAGFGDVNDDTIGGYFGHLETNDIVIPI